MAATRLFQPATLALVLAISAVGSESAASPTLSWQSNHLTIHGEHLPGGTIEALYLEAYCRAGSTTTDWSRHAVVSHETELLSTAADGNEIRLRCKLRGGVIVDHVIKASDDEVTDRQFRHRPHRPDPSGRRPSAFEPDESRANAASSAARSWT